MTPHGIGLGATFDPALALRLGKLTARDVRATGVHWNFAPVVDTQRDHRWGRSYEPFGEDPLLTGTMGAAMIRGMQGRGLARPDTVAATAKHFTGYSAPDSGRDRTDATISEQELQDIHVPPFAQAVEAGVATVMINSGSVNGEPVHASERLLTGVLRDGLGFGGVAVSDWNDVGMLMTKYGVAETMEQAVALAVNAGMDMSMIPLDASGFTQSLIAAVQHGKVSMARIDQAVGRILALKFRLGLFERPYVDADRANAVVEDPGKRSVARRAAAKSLVLLENDGTLPLSRALRKVLVTGPNADSPVNQLGGWSIGWQGAFNLPPDAPVPEVTTVREGIERTAGPGTEVVFRQGVPEGDTTNRSTTPDAPVPPDPVNDPGDPETAAAIDEAAAAAADADAVVAVVGESPYAEGQGDDDTPALPPSQAALVDRLAATGKPVVLVVIAGRPLVMEQQLDRAGASLMAFRPGSEGGAAIADALFGRTSPSGRLPVSWPASLDGFPLAYNEPGRPYEPRYPFGHGLSYADFETSRLNAARRVTAGQRVAAAVTLRNLSDRGAERVVLAFAEGVDGAAADVGRRLVAFERVFVPAGDRVRVPLGFHASRLAAAGPDGERTVAPGRYRLTVEGTSVIVRVGG